jgi:cytochrome c peroxidase
LPSEIRHDFVPRGLDADRRIPADNPMTPAAVQLGRKLFFDAVLSADRTVSCASCHDPAQGFTTRAPKAIGIQGRRSPRNAPTLLNRTYGSMFFWDGRERTLEAQALRPIEHPLEMGANLADIVSRLRDDAEYRKQFEAVFADGVTAANLGRALAAFQRTILIGDSRVDRFRAGEVAALEEVERHGLWLFESRGRCWRCHFGPNFTDEQLHNTGVSWGVMPLDLGRYEVTKQDADRGRFKTPTLRGVSLTAPYMHDGSIPDLEGVVQFYNRGGSPNPQIDPAIGPLELAKDEVAALVAFLRALSDSPPRAAEKHPAEANPAPGRP